LVGKRGLGSNRYPFITVQYVGRRTVVHAKYGEREGEGEKKRTASEEFTLTINRWWSCN